MGSSTVEELPNKILIKEGGIDMAFRSLWDAPASNNAKNASWPHYLKLNKDNDE